MHLFLQLYRSLCFWKSTCKLVTKWNPALVVMDEHKNAYLAIPSDKFKGAYMQDPDLVVMDEHINAHLAIPSAKFKGAYMQAT